MSKPTNSIVHMNTKTTRRRARRVPKRRSRPRSTSRSRRRKKRPTPPMWALAPVFTNRETDVLNGLGKTKAQYADYATSRVQLMRETGLPVATMKTLIDHEINDDLAAARGREPMPQPEFFEMRQRAHEQLRALYGDQATITSRGPTSSSRVIRR
jgi:hypothetical protein